MAVIAALVLMVGFIFAAVLRDAVPRQRASDEDFIEEVRSLQEQIRPEGGPGQLPPVGADPSLVPLIVLEPSSLDLGPLPNTAKSTAEIKVHNRGKARLDISDVQTTCACTRGVMDRERIPPGDTGTLTVTIDPFRIFGFESKKTLSLFTNDVKNSPLEVAVKVTIEPEFAVEPAAFDFGEVPQGAPAHITMVLVSVI